MNRPLLMIPGPVELAPAVVAACAEAPRSHLDPVVIDAFASAIHRMRIVWQSPPDALAFVVPGGGTLAMDMAAWNLGQPGRRMLVASSGYFSDRMAEMLRRTGADVSVVAAEPGFAPEAAVVAEELANGDRAGRRYDAVFVTHVDTSTGVRTDPTAMAAVAKAHGALVVVDGVCATGAERLDMAATGVDVVLTASQKALGAPAGLALMMVSPRAWHARQTLQRPPPMALDWASWHPVMQAYEARKPAYFGTPPTTLILGLDAALRDLLGVLAPAEALEARILRHLAVGEAMRAAWAALGLALLPVSPGVSANTLSAVRYPVGVGPALVAAVGKRGVMIAGGLYPALREAYFRVGHMGPVIDRPDDLERAVVAIGEGLVELGHRCDPADGRAALRRGL
jgi:alanine-glyoxylate transaminase/serine-glyoxylate transaminase/serine-pyruvate transaminase